MKMTFEPPLDMNAEHDQTALLRLGTSQNLVDSHPAPQVELWRTPLFIYVGIQAAQSRAVSLYRLASS